MVLYGLVYGLYIPNLRLVYGLVYGFYIVIYGLYIPNLIYNSPIRTYSINIYYDYIIYTLNI